MALMGGVIDLDVLNDVIRHKERFSAIPFENAFEWAAQQADLYPQPQAENIESRLDSEWEKVPSDYPSILSPTSSISFWVPSISSILRENTPHCGKSTSFRDRLQVLYHTLSHL